ncbi:helix-turn-helix transcriptional regulator [Enterococcus sp. AZ109]|uniref:helix-turn-helix transcriptional regulator n=1 Tax=Enterococcus sp. AZ109 TaxID=2774634 RepID=UPI003F27FD7C
MSNQLIQQVEQYIEEHLEQPITVGSLAYQLHYSKSHLLHEFSAATKWRLYDYIKKRRLHEAAFLLIEGQRPIIEIALISGYQNQQSFTKAFKEIYKISPRQFRQQKKPFGLVQSSEQSVSWSGQYTIKEVTIKEFPAIISYMEHIQWAFPYYDEATFTKVVKQRVQAGNVLTAAADEGIIGLLIYDSHRQHLDGLSSLPVLWDESIEANLLERLLNTKKLDQVTTTTFRSKDKLDIGHRQRLIDLGFQPEIQLIEFGYPTEQMIYKKKH